MALSGRHCSAPRPPTVPLAARPANMLRQRSVGIARDATTAAAQQVTGAEEFPNSQQESISQALEALNAAFAVDKKRKKKGFMLWPGIKRLAVEIPIADESPEAQLQLTQQLLSALPAAAGLPVVIFGTQAAADHARTQNAPFEVYSIQECEEDSDELEGPMFIVGASRDQAGACQRIAEDLWRGKALVVVNAGWLQDLPDEMKAFAETLDPVYFFLPVAFTGLLGGKTGFVFRWSESDIDAKFWKIFLDDGGIKSIGRMSSKPTQSDLETAVYNASAAQSPLTAGAKLVNKLTKGFKKK